MTPEPYRRFIEMEDQITVKINGVEYKVPSSFSEVSLNEYLRTHLHLTGTKVMCREGGCGACMVHVAYPDPSQPASTEMVQHSVNSCLCPILSTDKWEITTVEGLGTQEQPHIIQTRLTDNYGTQCGYCTPGMIMSMYSLLRTTPANQLTQQQVEDGFGGNICRCTGYRPILTAFKTFANAQCNLKDLEDIDKIICKKTGTTCRGTCKDADQHRGHIQSLPKDVADNSPPWHKPTTLDELLKLVATYKDDQPYLVHGHTGVGVYNDWPYGVYIDLKGVPDLYKVTLASDKIGVGANISLTKLIQLFEQQGKEGFAYMQGLAALISKTASPSVRHAGSWAGNLAMKNMHKDMPSDSFIGFAAADARIVIGQSGMDEKQFAMKEFLELDLKGRLILRVEFPAKTATTKFRTFKVMPRSQNSHSYVHAAFIADIDSSLAGQLIVKNQPALAFGNISSTFIRATQTELFLAGKDLADVQVLQTALQTLRDEIVPEQSQTEAPADVKKALSVSLLYKFALEIIGPSSDARYQSAIGSLLRPLSTGIQDYQTKEANWPITKPLPKLESLVQCSGEAKYVSDIEQEGLLHAAFAYTNRGNASVFSINTDLAAAYPGVVRVIVASDIPGENNMAMPANGPPKEIEPLLVKTEVRHAHQPVAIVVAVSYKIAETAAKLVEVKYTNEQPVITSAEEAAQVGSFFEGVKHDIVVGDAVGAIAGAAHKISGELAIGSQMHFHMETMTAVAFPTEDGLTVEASSQWLDGVQLMLSPLLKMPNNKIRVNCKRVGGGFGAKAMRNNSTVGAAGLAAYLLKRPVKVHMSLWDNARMISKRYPWYVKYQAGFDDSGKVLGVDMQMYCNIGAFQDFLGTFAPGPMMRNFLDNVYSVANWKVNLVGCKTHIPINTAARAPVSTEAIYFIDTIFEHVASVLGKPSIEVKRTNFMHSGDMLLTGSPLKEDCPIGAIVDQLLSSSTYADRLTSIQSFNLANRWRKRGMSVVPMRFPCHWAGSKYAAFVAIYHGDGTVIASHGGIEMGQGINTKVAQVIAAELGVDLKYVRIDSTNSVISANSNWSAGSITSELVCLAVMDACDQIKQRIQPVRDASPTLKWEELAEKCHGAGLDLTAHGWVSQPETTQEQYNTWGAMCTEVEVDTLTGEYQISRMDLLYDCGESMSPLVDIGQIEGSVVMGLGYFLTEEVIYDKNTAANLTFNTWTYKPPTSKDIPIDFRVKMLRDAPNPSGVLRSKIVGEPPLCMTVSVVYALRNAIIAARVENGQGGNWFRIDTPLTPARVLQYCKTDDMSQLRYKS